MRRRTKLKKMHLINECDEGYGSGDGCGKDGSKLVKVFLKEREGLIAFAYDSSML